MRFLSVYPSERGSLNHESGQHWAQYNLSEGGCKGANGIRDPKRHEGLMLRNDGVVWGPPGGDLFGEGMGRLG